MSFIFWGFFGLVVLFGFVVFWGAPYVPSMRRDVQRAFDELYPIGPADTVVDVGSGGGVILRAAAARGAKAVGYELNPMLVLVSRWLSRRSPAVQVYLANFWRVSLPAATTVVYAFSNSRDIGRIATKIASEATRLNKPLMFVSYGIAVTDRTPVRQVGAHLLYRIEPLHVEKA